MRVLSTVTLLALTLAACGGDGSTSTGDPTPPDQGASAKASPSSELSDEPTDTPAAPDAQSGLRTAVQAYSDAFLTGDGEAAFAILSERCQDRGKDRFLAVVDQAGELYGSALAFKTFEAEISSDMARVTYTYDVSAIDQEREPWVREGDAWREDDC